MFYGLSYLVDVRISCLVFTIRSSHSTVDHLLDKVTSTPVSYSEMVYEGLGVFSVVI